MNPAPSPEQHARKQVDAMLAASGRVVARVHNLRTNPQITLKTNQMRRAQLDEFVGLYAGPRAESEATPRWKAYHHDETVARDKCSLDLFWLEDDSMLDAEGLPDPDVIAREIADDLRAALEQIEEILVDLGGSA